MQAIPSALQARFEGHLRSKAIQDPLLWSYRKWLRYYLDYCEKYHFSSRDQNSLPRFIEKLRMQEGVRSCLLTFCLFSIIDLK